MSLLWRNFDGWLRLVNCSSGSSAWLQDYKALFASSSAEPCLLKPVPTHLYFTKCNRFIMADPLSITASIIAVVTFAAQVGGSIKSFIDDYRSADLELDAIAAEVNALCGVLKSLQGEYEEATSSAAHARLGAASKLKQLVKGKAMASGVTPEQADKALQDILHCLNGSMKQLDDVVKKSKDRMAKGGIYKIQVRALWQRTAKGIEKVNVEMSVIYRRTETESTDSEFTLWIQDDADASIASKDFVSISR